MDNHQGNTTKEAWILCLIFGVILINFPFIHIFSNDFTILGVPTLVLYFFIGWPASIFVIWLFVRQLENDEKKSDNNGTE